jgi:hypothetical protein
MEFLRITAVARLESLGRGLATLPPALLSHGIRTETDGNARN